MNPVLTAGVGDNSDIFPRVLQIYAKEGFKILDMTYGRGVFWKKVDREKYDCLFNDIDSELGDIHLDFRKMDGLNDESFNLAVLDPPYASRSGSGIKCSIDRGYNNRKRMKELGIFGTEATMQYYKEGMIEAFRLLKSKGILVVKCMDEIMSGKQQLNHITLINIGIQLGFIVEDLFVLVQKNVPTMRHNYQLHARKNHSYYIIFRKNEKVFQISIERSPRAN